MNSHFVSTIGGERRFISITLPLTATPSIGANANKSSREEKKECAHFGNLTASQPTFSKC